jgi:methyltransferase (TIGR00027 family)
MVTLLRALANAGMTHVKGFEDPTARHFLSPGWSKLYERVVRKSGSESFSEGVRSGSDLLALRTLVIDLRLREALARGVRQVVILGAGLDGRAFRLKELAHATVFEVDHPSTQAVKRDRAAGLTSTARSLVFVPVDFEKDSLGEALEAAGHRADEPTAWVWEGVVMYLTLEAVRQTLRTVADRSAPSSTVIIEYHTPAGGGRGGLLKALVLRFWGEPQIGLRPPGEMMVELNAVDFRVTSDSGTSDWARHYGIEAPPYAAAHQARILVANR